MERLRQSRRNRFPQSLRIETVKPNRLKINLKLPEKAIQASTKEIPVMLTSTWLTGATASRLKTKVEMSLSKVNTQFKNYGQYIFNNPATEFTTVKTMYSMEHWMRKEKLTLC